VEGHVTCPIENNAPGLMIHDILVKMLGKKRFREFTDNGSKAEGDITCRHILISMVGHSIQQ
jgi:hypothetical protein